MVDERLHFASLDSSYHAFEGSVHVARYALARSLCVGKSVLDIACGEGYGSMLLRRWGANRVIGVDIATEAIEVAKTLFTDPAIEHICCDAYNLPVQLGEEIRFDLITVFETIEHVSDPARLLRMLQSMLAVGGVLIVSCPNDPVAFRDGGSNPFHKTCYSFENFKNLCEYAIGPATQWMIQTPSIGAVLISLEPRIGEDAGKPDILCGVDLDHSIIMPPQYNVRPVPDDCLAYIAIWGAQMADAQVATPVSYSGYMNPWNRVLAAERVEVDLAKAEQVILNLQTENRRLKSEQQEDRQQLLLYAGRINPDRNTLAPTDVQLTRVYKITHSRWLASSYIYVVDHSIFGPTLRKIRSRIMR